jgi:diketogulonate reductase-like aldo/keto reductase
VHPRDFGKRATKKVFQQSQRNLGSDYVDALLLHYKGCWGTLCDGVVLQGTWKDAWRAFEKLHTKGLAKTLGASNADVGFLNELWEFAQVKPELVQNHMDPFAQDTAVRRWCAKHGVVYQAYSSLGTQHRLLGFNPVLGSKVLGDIAATHAGRSVAEVVLQSQLQQGVGVIPRSSDKQRLAQNLALGHDMDDWLSPAEMEAIAALDGTRPEDARGRTEL